MVSSAARVHAQWQRFCDDVDPFALAQTAGSPPPPLATQRGRTRSTATTAAEIARPTSATSTRARSPSPSRWRDAPLASPPGMVATAAYSAAARALPLPWSAPHRRVAPDPLDVPPHEVSAARARCSGHDAAHGATDARALRRCAAMRATPPHLGTPPHVLLDQMRKEAFMRASGDALTQDVRRAVALLPARQRGVLSVDALLATLPQRDAASPRPPSAAVHGGIDAVVAEDRLVALDAAEARAAWAASRRNVALARARHDALRAVRASPRTLETLAAAHRDDEAVVRAAVTCSRDGGVLRWASPRLQRDASLCALARARLENSFEAQVETLLAGADTLGLELPKAVAVKSAHERRLSAFSVAVEAAEEAHRALHAPKARTRRTAEAEAEARRAAVEARKNAVVVEARQARAAARRLALAEFARIERLTPPHACAPPQRAQQRRAFAALPLFAPSEPAAAERSDGDAAAEEEGGRRRADAADAPRALFAPSFGMRNSDHPASGGGGRRRLSAYSAAHSGLQARQLGAAADVLSQRPRRAEDAAARATRSLSGSSSDSEDSEFNMHTANNSEASDGGADEDGAGRGRGAKSPRPMAARCALPGLSTPFSALSAAAQTAYVDRLSLRARRALTPEQRLEIVTSSHDPVQFVALLAPDKTGARGRAALSPALRVDASSAFGGDDDAGPRTFGGEPPPSPRSGRRPPPTPQRERKPAPPNTPPMTRSLRGPPPSRDGPPRSRPRRRFPSRESPARDASLPRDASPRSPLALSALAAMATTPPSSPHRCERARRAPPPSLSAAALCCAVPLLHAHAALLKLPPAHWLTPLPPSSTPPLHRAQLAAQPVAAHCKFVPERAFDGTRPLASDVRVAAGGSAGPSRVATEEIRADGEWDLQRRGQCRSGAP